MSPTSETGAQICQYKSQHNADNNSFIAIVLCENTINNEGSCDRRVYRFGKFNKLFRFAFKLILIHIFFLVFESNVRLPVL